MSLIFILLIVKLIDDIVRSSWKEYTIGRFIDYNEINTDLVFLKNDKVKTRKFPKKVPNDIIKIQL